MYVGTLRLQRSLPAAMMDSKDKRVLPVLAVPTTQSQDVNTSGTQHSAQAKQSQPRSLLVKPTLSPSLVQRLAYQKQLEDAQALLSVLTAQILAQTTIRQIAHSAARTVVEQDTAAVPQSVTPAYVGKNVVAALQLLAATENSPEQSAPVPVQQPKPPSPQVSTPTQQTLAQAHNLLSPEVMQSLVPGLESLHSKRPRLSAADESLAIRAAQLLAETQNNSQPSSGGSMVTPTKSVAQAPTVVSPQAPAQSPSASIPASISSQDSLKTVSPMATAPGEPVAVDIIQHVRRQLNKYASTSTITEGKAEVDKGGKLKTNRKGKRRSREEREEEEHRQLLDRLAMLSEETLSKLTQQVMQETCARQQLLEKEERQDPTKLFQCGICLDMFETAEIFQEHVAKEHSPYLCSYCSESLSSPSDLRDHVNQHHSPYMCGFCKGGFSNVDELDTHISNCSSNNCYRCHRCKKNFSSLEILSVHTEVHTSGVHRCWICRKAFKVAAALKKHNMTHTGEKPFKCDECDAAFVCKQHLVRHKYTHMDTRPYPCPHCPRTFLQPQDVTRHLRTHTGEKPFHCEKCDKSFTRLQHYKRHLITPLHLHGKRSETGKIASGEKSHSATNTNNTSLEEGEKEVEENMETSDSLDSGALSNGDFGLVVDSPDNHLLPPSTSTGPSTVPTPTTSNCTNAKLPTSLSQRTNQSSTQLTTKAVTTTVSAVAGGKLPSSSVSQCSNNKAHVQTKTNALAKTTPNSLVQTRSSMKVTGATVFCAPVTALSASSAPVLPRSAVNASVASNNHAQQLRNGPFNPPKKREAMSTTQPLTVSATTNLPKQTFTTSNQKLQAVAPNTPPSTAVPLTTNCTPPSTYQALPQ